jgi:hypothetical protein
LSTSFGTKINFADFRMTSQHHHLFYKSAWLSEKSHLQTVTLPCLLTLQPTEYFVIDGTRLARAATVNDHHQCTSGEPDVPCEQAAMKLQVLVPVPWDFMRLALYQWRLNEKLPMSEDGNYEEICRRFRPDFGAICSASEALVCLGRWHQKLVTQMSTSEQLSSELQRRLTADPTFGIRWRLSIFGDQEHQRKAMALQFLEDFVAESLWMVFCQRL